MIITCFIPKIIFFFISKALDDISSSSSFSIYFQKIIGEWFACKDDMRENKTIF